MTSSLAIGAGIFLAIVLVTVGWYVLSNRKAHALTPVTMLRPRSRARSRSIFQPLSIGDAVSHAGADYVVEDISSSLRMVRPPGWSTWCPGMGLPATGGSPSRLDGTELAWLDAAAMRKLQAPGNWHSVE